MNKRRLVLSTKLLSKKDGLIIKSLCTLLSDKLKASWQVSSDAEKGDLIICAKEQSSFMVDGFNFRLNLDKNSGDNNLRYPFHSQEFVTKLNSISIS